MAKIIFDSLSIKITGTIIIAMLVFTTLAVFTGHEFKDQDLVTKDKNEIQDEEDISKNQNGMFDKVFDSIKNALSGIGAMVQVLGGAPILILSILITIVPLLIAVVIIRSFDVSI